MILLPSQRGLQPFTGGMAWVRFAVGWGAEEGLSAPKYPCPRAVMRQTGVLTFRQGLGWDRAAKVMPPSPCTPSFPVWSFQSPGRSLCAAAGNHPQPVCNTSWCSTSFTPPPNILGYLLCRLILYLETPRRKLQESWIAEFLCSLTVPS